jgi:hypothetical protein
MEGKYSDAKTDMMVNLLANEDKLKSENKRWQYGDGGANLDENIDNIIGPKKDVPNVFIPQDNKPADNNNNHNNHNNNHNNDNVPPFSDKKDNKDIKDIDDESSWTHEERMLRKLDMLRKLTELANSGVRLSQNYNMDSDYKTMKYEYTLHKDIRARQNSINWMSNMSLMMVNGIEMLNETYNPFDLKLKGWSEAMNSDINSYYDVFGDLYEKYNQPGKSMAPELKLLLMISGSALRFHLVNSTFGKMPTLNSTLDQDPQLAEKLREKAMANKMAGSNNEDVRRSREHHERIAKEHEEAAKKMLDLKMLQEKELERMNHERHVAQKNAELNELKKKLMTPNVQNQNTQAVLQVTPIMQKLMEQQQQQLLESQKMKQEIDFIEKQKKELLTKELELIKMQKTMENKSLGSQKSNKSDKSNKSNTNKKNKEAFVYSDSERVAPIETMDHAQVVSMGGGSTKSKATFNGKPLNNKKSIHIDI